MHFQRRAGADPEHLGHGGQRQRCLQQLLAQDPDRNPTAPRGGSRGTQAAPPCSWLQWSLQEQTGEASRPVGSPFPRFGKEQIPAWGGGVAGGSFGRREMGSPQRSPASPSLPGPASLPSELVLLLPPVAHLEQKFRGCPGIDAAPVPRTGSQAVSRTQRGSPPLAAEKGQALPGDTGLEVMGCRAPGAVLHARAMAGRTLLALGEVAAAAATGAGSAAGLQPQPPAKHLQQAGAGSSPAPEEKHPRREVHVRSAHSVLPPLGGDRPLELVGAWG